MMPVAARIQSRLRDFQDFQELGGPVIRTNPLLERIFPTVIWRHPSTDSTSPIHLSFDDGPSDDGTERILDVLSRHEVRASFFVTGSSLYHRDDLVRQIQDAGHTIGYHGLTHDTWWMRAGYRRELEMDPHRIPLLENNPFISTDEPLILRAPYGRIDFATLHTAKQLNAWLVHWSLAMRDWMANISASTMARIMFRYVQPGDIVLLHDRGPSVKATAQALDRVIPMWKDAGMRISPLESFFPIHIQ